jgi:hypothetical protein
MAVKQFPVSEENCSVIWCSVCSILPGVLYVAAGCHCNCFTSEDQQVGREKQEANTKFLLGGIPAGKQAPV